MPGTCPLSSLYSWLVCTLRASSPTSHFSFPLQRCRKGSAACCVWLKFMRRKVKLRGARHCFNYTLLILGALIMTSFSRDPFRKAGGGDRISNWKILIVTRVPDLQLHWETYLGHKIHQRGRKTHNERLAILKGIHECAGLRACMGSVLCMAIINNNWKAYMTIIMLWF